MDIVKNILQSKTFWLNILGPVFVWMGAHGAALDPDTQAAVILVIMGVLNIIMRRFTTGAVTVLSVKK